MMDKEFSETVYEFEVKQMSDEELLKAFKNIMGVYDAFEGSSPPNIEGSVLLQRSITDKQYIIAKREMDKRNLSLNASGYEYD